MKIAGREDKSLVLDILSYSFDTNPSTNRVVKNDSRRKERIRALCDFVFELAFLQKGVILSDDRKGVAVILKYGCLNCDQDKPSIFLFLMKVWLYIRFAVQVPGYNRIFSIALRESKVSAIRNLKKPCILFWFFGVKAEDRGGRAAFELKNYVLNKADAVHLPVYLETSVEQNRRVYQKYGFKVYHTWHEESRGINLYFMKRESIGR
jgi:hypothetical protein